MSHPQSQPQQKPLTTTIQEKPWQCPSCTFKNHPTIDACQMCTTERPETGEKKMEIEKNKNGGFRCHACEHQLTVLVSKCPNCGEVLIPESDQEEQPSKTKKKSQKKQKDSALLKCRSCGQDNDLTNTSCVFCEQNLIEQQPIVPIPTGRRAPRKPRPKSYSRAYRTTVQTCKYCKIAVYGTTLEAHQLACTHLNGQQLQLRYLTVQKTHCPFCYKKFPQTENYDSHSSSCPSRKQFYSSSSPTYERCTKLQRDTMIYMHNKSEKLHWIAQEPLLKRVVGLGFRASDLENLHHYIVNYAPIIIHMHVNSHMQFFVKDTHYRNQFETKKSSGSLSESSRTNWQDRMFDKMHHNATPFQRVKYGTINFTNDPKGVQACTSYGQSYFLLKPHVRNRCTLTDMDSSSPSATIATFQFCYHLLNKLPDAELRAAFEGSKANQVASSVIGTYKEIQIHGPVQFKRDIERVYVNKAELGDPKHLEMVKEFCKNNDLEYEIFGHEPVVASPYAPFGIGAVGFGTGLFAPAPAPAPVSYGFGGFGFGGSTDPSSIFSVPRPTATTAHLWGGRRTTYPATGVVPLPAAQKKQEDLKEGIDYI